MRFFVAGLVHESNSFSPLPTTRDAFGAGVLIRRGEPQALERVLAQPVPGGALQAAAEAGDTVVHGLFAEAQPSAPLRRADYEALRDELLADLRATQQSAQPADAVLLVLHGAMLAEGTPDCEGDLLQRVRALVGPRVPVGALLDLHGNLTPAMVDSGAALVACKEYPHVDYAARGRELHAMLTRMARGGLALQAHGRRVPMLGIFGTTEPPMRDFVRDLQAAERQPGIVSVSAFHGFPWSDTEHTGAALLVLAEAGSDAGGRLADELAQRLFALREAAGARPLTVDQALAAVAAAPPGPVVLADVADNPGGGAACDSTFVLRALLQHGVRDAALAMLWDPAAVALATAAGAGARLRLRLGGRHGPVSGEPLDVDAEVLACRPDARQRGLVPGSHDALGDAVALRVQGVDIVVNSLRQQVFSPDCFTELGIDPRARRVLVVKSTQHFRAGFDPLAAATFCVDTPGTLSADLSRLPWRHLRRPLWPLDQAAGGPSHFS